MTHELSINPFEELNIDSKSLGPPRPCLRIRERERKTLTCQVLNLLFKGHQFEFHKSQSYWKFTWLLTSGLVRLIEVCAS